MSIIRVASSLGLPVSKDRMILCADCGGSAPVQTPEGFACYRCWVELRMKPLEYVMVKTAERAWYPRPSKYDRKGAFTR